MSVESEDRPWGSWHVIDVSEGYKIKRIHVTPGCRLSLQTHEHRSEHWVVLAGTAIATCDGERRLFRENEVLGMPIGSVHEVENPGRISATLLEIRVGGYLSDADEAGTLPHPAA